MPEHLGGGQMMRELVDGGGRESILGSQGPQKRWPEEHGARAMDGGIAGVDRQGIVAVFLSSLANSTRHLVQRLVPGNLSPVIALPAKGTLQAIRVAVEILESDCLRTDMPLAQRVLGVAAYRDDAVALKMDFDAAHGLAEIAGSVVDTLLF